LEDRREWQTALAPNAGNFAPQVVVYAQFRQPPSTSTKPDAFAALLR
jgi:hypothetical protein